MNPVKYLWSVIPLLIYCVLGCNKTSQYYDVSIIDLERSISSYANSPLSTIARKIEYIPLETEENSIIGPIREIVVSDDTIIVRGYDYCKTFNRYGKFLFNIGRIGHGPGEYQSINAFSVNREKNLIYITCNGKIEVYTYKGEYIHTVDIPFERWSRSKFINDSIFCHQVIIRVGNETNKLFFFNKHGEIIDSFINRQPYERKFRGLIVAEQPQLYQGCNYFIFHDGLNDTIYKISSDLRISPLYKIEFGRYKFPLDIIKDLANTEIPFQEYIFLNEIVESKNYIFMYFKFGKHYPFKYRKEETVSGTWFGPSFTYERTEVAGIYNKKESSFALLNGENGMGFINDIDGGLSFWPTYTDHKNNEMYAWVDAYEFVNMFNERQARVYAFTDSMAYLKLKQLTTNLNSMGNPVIIKVTPKLE